MQALLTEAATNATKAVVTLQLNYIKTPIMAVLMPMLTDALKEGVEDAKAEVKAAAAAGAEVKEEEVKVVVGPRGRKPLHERLAKDEKEACPDTNILHLESCPTQYAWIGPQWTGYQMYTIKFGTQKESGLFYSVGYQYTLRHRNMRELDTRLRTEFKDDKEALAQLPPLPDDCQHGVTCLCITRSVDTYGQHARFKNYMSALQKKPFVHSRSAADLFRIGDDWEAQRLLKEVFDKAVTDTVEELLGRPACKWCEFKDPFDETEAVRQLLYLTGTPTTQRLRGMINPPFCVYNARQAAEGVLLGQLEVVANSWSAGQEALNKLKKEALAAVTEGGERMVAALKPHLIKVLTLVQSKVDGKKEEKKGEEKEEKKEVKIGDTTFNWHFSQTGVGARLLAAMHSGSTAEAIRTSESDLNPRTVLERGVADVATAVGAGGAQDAPGIGPVIRDLTREIYNQLYRFNTLAPLLSAARSLAEVRDASEAALKEAATDPAKIAAAIDAQSMALWDKGLGGAVLKMFASYQSIRAQVQSAYADPVPEEAATAMIDFVDYLYDSHVRALNSLRVRYIQLLRAALATPEGIASADLVAEHSKKCFAQAFFEIADVLMDDFWMVACDKIIVYACATAFAAFKKSVWPELAEMLGAIKSVLPEPVAKANVHEAVVLALVQVVIKKAMTALVTKMLVFAEQKIYDQSS